MRDYLERALDSRRGPWLILGLALLLCAPALGHGLTTDDHLMVEALDRGVGPLELFEASVARMSSDRLHGVWSWWSSEQLEYRFMRPLSSLTHWLEHRLYRAHALPMYLLNMLVYGLLLLTALRIFQALLPAGAARLAALMFAVNEAHAASVGWISARNTLLATLFALLALHAYHRWRGGAAAIHGALSVLWTGLALASGEAGSVVFAYLLAHASCLDPASWSRRARALSVHAALGGLWFAAYVGLGFGVRGAGWYRDVGAHPLQTVLSWLGELPIWLFSLLGPSVVSATITLPAAPVRLACLLLVLPLLVALAPHVRASREGRFFATSIALGVVPLMTTVPQDRLLIGLSMPAFGVIALLLAHPRGAPGRLQRHVQSLMRVVHLVLAPLLFIPVLGSLLPMDASSRRFEAACPDGAGRQVVLLNAPVELLGTYARAMRANAGRPALDSQHVLYAGSAPVTIRRPDERTLELEVARGWAHNPLERINAHPDALPRSGAVLELANMRVQVLQSTAAGTPRRVRFRFPTALEDDVRSFLVWQGSDHVHWQPPAPGTVVQLPALHPFTSMRP